MNQINIFEKLSRFEHQIKNKDFKLKSNIHFGFKPNNNRQIKEKKIQFKIQNWRKFRKVT